MCWSNINFADCCSHIHLALIASSRDSTNGQGMHGVSIKMGHLLNSWLPPIIQMAILGSLWSTEVVGYWFMILHTIGHNTLQYPALPTMTLCFSLSRKALVMLGCALGKLTKTIFCIYFVWFMLMSKLFTCASSSWALVKDEQVAKRMTKYIELSTIGVSKDSQLRAAKVLKVVSDSCEHPSNSSVSLFEFGFHLMAERWKQLRVVVNQSVLFSLPEFSSEFCKFHSQFFKTQPGKYN